MKVRIDKVVLGDVVMLITLSRYEAFVPPTT
jgi:hypothetical protein